MSRITKCDRCGAEIIGESVGIISIRNASVKTGEFLNGNAYRDFDFCDECINKISAFIELPMREKSLRAQADAIIPDNFKDDVAFLDQEDPEKEEPAPVVKKARTFKLDMERVMDLRNKGFSLEYIAKEFGCATQTIANHIKREEQRYGEFND